MAQMRETPGGAGQIKFNPYQMTSIVPLLEDQAQRDKVNMARYKEGLDQNMEAIRATAEAQEKVNRRYFAERDQLAKFSQTLTDQLIADQKARNDQEMEEGIAMAYTDGVSIEQEIELENREGQLRADDQMTQPAGGAAYEQTGSYEVKQRVSGLSGWRAYGYQIGRAQVAGDDYGSWLEQRLAGINPGSTAELSAAVAEARGEFIRQYGLAGADVAVLNKYAFPSMRRAEGSFLRDRQQSMALDASSREQDEAKAAFQADKDLGSLITRLSTTLGGNGKLLGNRGAHEMAKQYIADSIKAGTIDVTEVRAMAQQVVPWDKKGRTFAELYPNLVEGSIRDALAVDRADARIDREEQIAAADRFVDEVRQKIMADPEAYNLKDIEALQKEYFERTGKTSSQLDQLANKYNSTAMSREDQRQYLTTLQATGRLRPHHLKGIDPTIAIQFQSIAEGNAKAANASGGAVYKNALNSIKREVANGRNETTGDGSIGIVTQMIVSELQSRFMTKVGEFTAANPNDPEGAIRLALADVRNYWQAEGGGLDSQNSQGRFFYQGPTGDGNAIDNYLQNLNLSSGPTEAGLNALKSTIDDYRTKGEVVFSEPGKILSQSALEEMDKTYGTSGFQIPSNVLYLSQKTGVDPYRIIDLQRQAAGLTPLPSPSADRVQSMTPRGQALLNQFRSQNRSQRAYSMEIGAFEPEMVTHGQLYAAAGAANGIDPGLIAAMGEIESRHARDAISYNGSSFGVMQINKAAHPQFFANGDWQDAEYNINYGAQYYAGLYRQYGDPKAAAMAYNAGPGYYDDWVAGRPIPARVEREMIAHGKKFMKAYSRYNRASLQDPLTRRGQFQVVQLVTSDPRVQTSADRSVVRDDHGHGGDAMHQHYEFATKEQALLAKKMYESKGFRVTSYIRPGDPGAHGKGYAIDVAPPLDLARTDEAETAWIDKANSVIGYRN